MSANVAMARLLEQSNISERSRSPISPWASDAHQRPLSPTGSPTARHFDVPGWLEREHAPGRYSQTLIDSRQLTPEAQLPLLWPATTRTHQASSPRPLRQPEANAAAWQVGAAAEADDEYTLNAADNVEMRLTAPPAAQTAAGLESAVAEAKSHAKSLGARGAELLSGAISKLDEQKAEYERCAREREGRLGAFRSCAPLQRMLSDLFCFALTNPPSAAPSATPSAAPSAGAPRRLDFLNLHLGLTREGYFESERAGQAVAAYPFCFAPPTYVQYLEGLWPRKSSEADDDDDVADDIWGDDDSGEADLEELEHWDCSIRLWRLLLSRGGVQGGLLTLEALTEAIFELADAHLLQQQTRVVLSYPSPAATPPLPRRSPLRPPPLHLHSSSGNRLWPDGEHQARRLLRLREETHRRRVHHARGRRRLPASLPG